ncbi:MAG: glucose-6-phosphate isomerase, partial [Verrucomicrobiae bacterium]|nr:glucose-6-phosphate isomerase [Verrucomicrobiae bacterium]
MSWQSYNENLLRYPDFGFSIDFSLMDIEPSFYQTMKAKIDRAFADIAELEAGAIANPDEGRMVGHYWLRNPELAPSAELKHAITEPLDALKDFARKVHSGE